MSLQSESKDNKALVSPPSEESEEREKEDFCPHCGAELQNGEGCRSCPFCGFSHCLL